MATPSNSSLYVYHLPKHCSEGELAQVFSTYGAIMAITVYKNQEKPFAVVIYSNPEDSDRARLQLNGCVFMGRKIRISKAPQPENGGGSSPTSQTINSIYVRYSSQNVDKPITGPDLQRIFTTYGTIEDVSIKVSSIDQRTGVQSGYAFVHFSSDELGVQAAIQAVASMDCNTVDGIKFKAELSRNLLKQFEPGKDKSSLLSSSAPASAPATPQFPSTQQFSPQTAYAPSGFGSTPSPQGQSRSSVSTQQYMPSMQPPVSYHSQQQPHQPHHYGQVGQPNRSFSGGVHGPSRGSPYMSQRELFVPAPSSFSSDGFGSSPAQSYSASPGQHYGASPGQHYGASPSQHYGTSSGQQHFGASPSQQHYGGSPGQSYGVSSGQQHFGASPGQPFGASSGQQHFGPPLNARPPRPDFSPQMYQHTHHQQSSSVPAQQFGMRVIPYQQNVHARSHRAQANSVLSSLSAASHFGPPGGRTVGSSLSSSSSVSASSVGVTTRESSPYSSPLTRDSDLPLRFMSFESSAPPGLPVKQLPDEVFLGSSSMDSQGIALGGGEKSYNPWDAPPIAPAQSWNPPGQSSDVFNQPNPFA